MAINLAEQIPMKTTFSKIVLISLIALIVTPTVFSVDKSNPNWRNKMTKPKMMTFDKQTDYYWVMDTNKGTIKIKLLADIAPMHATSTIYLTKEGFYDSLIFHRVIKNFMAQGGCPNGSGRGNPGYKYSGEFDRNVRHDRPYLLSMANAGPNTDGSQFFITFVPTLHLDGKHTIFGEVTEGQDVVKTLESFGSSSGKTTEKLFIKKATIVEVKKGDAKGAPKLKGEFTADSCCDKASKKGKACGHGCCKKAAADGNVCAKCNKAKEAPKKSAIKFKPGSCCDKADKKGETCSHSCCKKAIDEGKACPSCNG